MKRYSVGCGPYGPIEVDAENEAEAWAKFCENDARAARHPNAFERTIKEVNPADTKPGRPQPVPTVATTTAPISELTK